MRTATIHLPRSRTALVWVVLVWGLVLGAVLSLGGCGGGSDTREVADTGGLGTVDYSTSGNFPVPPEIRPNVDFWRHVYGVWSRGQVAFHDDEHMGVIYEVARLPGPIQQGYTPYQKQFVDSRKAHYQNRVADLERKVRSSQSLSSDDKALLAKFQKAGGASALYGASERVRVQRGLRERFRRGVEISGRYDQAFREVMRANGVPEDLAYLPHVESSFQTNARSSVGAAGVWQFMPSTGRLYMNVNGAVDERLDPIICANGAARYLAQAHSRLGSWPLAITSYNHGVGGMSKARAQHGNDIGRVVKDYNGPAFGFASRNFYSEFMAAREVARNAKRYFPEGVHYEPPWPHDRLVLRASMPAHHVANHYGVSTGSLASLNLHWRDGARDGRAALPAGSTVWLPAGSMRRVAGQPSAYAGSAMLARSEPAATPLSEPPNEPRFEPRNERRIEPQRESRPRPEPALASIEPDEPEPAARAPVARVPAPEPVRPSWGGGGGIISSANAGELPPPRPKADRPMIVVPSEAKPVPVAAKAPESKPKTEAKLAQSKSKPDTGDTKAMQAKGKPSVKDTKTAQAKGKPDAKDTKTAQGKGKPDAKDAKLAKSEKPEAKGAKVAKKADAKPESKSGKAQAKFHVVKPQETLYRVATLNGISVEQLRRLNKMGPKDNSIRPGQKLKVDI